MSGYGMFEAAASDGFEEQQRQREAEKKLAGAIHAAREQFSDFLGGAKDKADFDVRLALVKKELRACVESNGVMPVTGVMNKVAKSMKPSFGARTARTRKTADDTSTKDQPDLDKMTMEELIEWDRRNEWHNAKRREAASSFGKSYPDGWEWTVYEGHHGAEGYPVWRWEIGRDFRTVDQNSEGIPIGEMSRDEIESFLVQRIEELRSGSGVALASAKPDLNDFFSQFDKTAKEGDWDSYLDDVSPQSEPAAEKNFEDGEKKKDAKTKQASSHTGFWSKDSGNVWTGEGDYMAGGEGNQLGTASSALEAYDLFASAGYSRTGDLGPTPGLPSTYSCTLTKSTEAKRRKKADSDFQPGDKVFDTAWKGLLDEDGPGTVISVSGPDEVIVDWGTGYGPEPAIPSELRLAKRVTASDKFQPGDKVLKSGYPGTVIREYMDGMYEVRLQSGEVVVPGSELTRQKESRRKQAAPEKEYHPANDWEGYLDKTSPQSEPAAEKNLLPADEDLSHEDADKNKNFASKDIQAELEEAFGEKNALKREMESAFGEKRANPLFDQMRAAFGEG